MSMGATDIEREHFAQKTGLSDPAVFIHDGVIDAQQDLLDRCAGVTEDRNAVGDPFVDAPSELEKHVVFGGKMKVEGASGDTGGAGDSIDLRGSESDLPKLAQCHLEDSLAGLCPLAGPGSRCSSTRRSFERTIAIRFARRLRRWSQGMTRHRERVSQTPQGVNAYSTPRQITKCPPLIPPRKSARLVERSVA
jgi:hypothetical protein